MHLVRQDRLHFKEGNSDKVYEVDLCEINGLFVVNFRYGRHGTDLKEGSKTAVPVGREEADKIFQKLVDEKTRKGYHIVGKSGDDAEEPKVAVVLNNDANARNNAVLAKLQNAKAKSDPKIERAIWRTGELKIKEAAKFITPLIGTGKELRDYCCAWALGLCGDENFLDEVQKLASHKSQAVRRIAFEATLKLSANPQNLIEQKISELPEDFRQLVRLGNSENQLAALRETIAAHKRGSLDILEQIYIIADENSRSALLEILREIPLKSKFFKPLRHIYKIAEYRFDAEFFGVIARRFETEKAGFHSNPWWDSMYLQDENGKWSSIKRSDELASDNSRIAFSDRTKSYFLRRTWRFLRKLGELGDADYVKIAVGALLAYSDADAQSPRTSTRYDYTDENGNWDWRNPKTFTTVYDEYAPYLLFNHITRGQSERYELKPSAKAFNLKEGIENTKTDQREENFPELWEAQPVGLLHLLSESECQPIHEFAVKILRDCNEFTSQLDLQAVLMLLKSRYEVTAEFGFTLAKPFYNSANPNVELILAAAISQSEKARNEAFDWINAHRELFAKNDEAMFQLLTADFTETRKYAANLLQSHNYSEAEAQTLIGKILAQMLGFDEADGEKAADLSETLFKTFGKNLRSLNLSVVQDLLSHKLLAVQELGGNILLNHETPAENLPGELINSLIESPSESIRAIGIKLFGQFSDENLVKRDDVLFSFLTHELEDIYFSARPIIRRLTAQNADFADVITRRLIIALTQKEEREGLHSRFLTVLREDLPDWTNFVDEDLARILASSRFPNTAEAGGIALQKHADKWFEDFTTEEIIAFSNNEVLAIRQAAWDFAEKAKNRFSSETNPDFETETMQLVKALDSKWQDSREFWFGFFNCNLTEKELSPEIIVSICDSVRADVQKFGRETILKCFRAENGVEYMLKLSEHPSPNMSLFVTNYLESYASDSLENFAKLAPYFVRTLCLVNRGRIAKTRILNFLESEGLKSAKAGKIAADILARQSATVAIGDKARSIEMMLKIHRAFPEIDVPLKVKETQTREFNRV